MDSSFITRILSSIKEYGDKTAVVDCNAGRRTSYNQIYSMALRVVSLIRSEGVRKGSYVAVLLPGKVEFVASELGIWLAGCVCVPIGFSTPADRRDYILDHCGCTFRIDGETFAEAMKRSPAEDVPVPDEDDEALLSYTSGSTGRPKGIVLTFKSFVNPLAVMDEVLKAGPRDRYLSGSRTYFILHLMFYLFLKGTEVHILRPQEISDLTALQRYAREQRITVMFLSPALLASYRNEDGDLRMIMTGSDKVTSVNPDGYTVSVFYGMSELAGAMLYGCFDKPTSDIVYNGVVSDFQIKVDEPDGNGEGELCLKGPCCKGYFKDEEATAALFRDGWLHTGDIVRKTKDGSLVYVNRKDWMVKINGQRVEPGEVEAAMRAVDGVEDALVKGFGTAGGSARLVGYYISSTATEEDVRDGLEKSVPSYMIPSAFVRMDSFPLNANGKKDRNALEEPAAVSADYVAPSTPVEKELCEAFAKVLSLPAGSRVGVNDDFYALGGDSISVMALMKMCPELDLSSRIIYLKRTPAAIAAGLEGGKQGDAALDGVVEAPLTQTQLGIYAECDRRTGEAVYNNPFLFRIDGELDMERLADAFKTAFAAHPVLGARIAVGRDGSPVMRLEPGSVPPVKSRRMTESALESLKAELVKPFDLRKDCLCRLMLIQTEKSGYVFVDIHHIIFDGSSMGILLKDVDTAYNGGTVEQEAFSAFDVANRERRERLSDA
ncbi:MAG: AMP-binding protein, partial [Bacteroidales bacterium]|nr:AMP-binding protein [Bacteroidales bacterium]